jgi:hypothetical protein
MGNAISRPFNMAKPEESLVAKFEAVSREMKGQDFNASSATMSRRITDPQGMEAFHDWMMAYPSFRAPINFRLTGEEFVGQVESMNFLNRTACDNLIECMGRSLGHTGIPIGFDGRILFSLSAAHLLLKPHSRKKKTLVRPSRDSLLPRCFLGLNATVQPANPPGDHRRADLSRVSTQLVESADADADAPGFVFFQLGVLGYVIREEGHEGPWQQGEKRTIGVRYSLWSRTGFVVVVRLTPSGYADGIYIIYDMHDDIYGDPMVDYPSDYILSHGHWGHLPSMDDGPRVQFSCAKLGPRLSSLGKNHQLVVTDLIQHPVELVRAKRLEDGGIVRTTVDEKSWPSAVGGGSGIEEGGK